MHKDSRKVKYRIKKAFINLMEKNIIAFPDFLCCNNCASSEMYSLMKKDKFIGFAFYHNQDLDGINEYGSCCISYGPNLNIGKEVFNELKNCGLKVEWSGKLEQRISVSL